jgi:hypothetical protein
LVNGRYSLVKAQFVNRYSLHIFLANLSLRALFTSVHQTYRLDFPCHATVNLVFGLVEVSSLPVSWQVLPSSQAFLLFS